MDVMTISDVDCSSRGIHSSVDVSSRGMAMLETQRIRIEMIDDTVIRLE